MPKSQKGVSNHVAEPCMTKTMTQNIAGHIIQRQIRSAYHYKSVSISWVLSASRYPQIFVPCKTLSQSCLSLGTFVLIPQDIPSAVVYPGWMCWAGKVQQTTPKRCRTWKRREGLGWAGMANPHVPSSSSSLHVGSCKVSCQSSSVLKK